MHHDAFRVVVRGSCCDNMSWFHVLWLFLNQAESCLEWGSWPVALSHPGASHLSGQEEVPKNIVWRSCLPFELWFSLLLDSGLASEGDYRLSSPCLRTRLWFWTWSQVLSRLLFLLLWVLLSLFFAICIRVEVMVVGWWGREGDVFGGGLPYELKVSGMLKRCSVFFRYKFSWLSSPHTVG